MVRIKDEHDIETLRQIALLQDNENTRLVERVTRFTVENLRLRGFDDTGQLELEIRRNLEAAREEILRIDEKKKKEKAATPTNKRTGHGPRSQPELPTVERVLELPEAERKCWVCDGELGEMGGQYEESEVVTVVKRSSSSKSIAGRSTAAAATRTWSPRRQRRSFSRAVATR